jgi:hypothetical protein
MNNQLEAIMGNGENTLKVGSNPCRTANHPQKFIPPPANPEN